MRTTENTCSLNTLYVIYRIQKNILDIQFSSLYINLPVIISICHNCKFYFCPFQLIPGQMMVEMMMMEMALCLEQGRESTLEASEWRETEVPTTMLINHSVLHLVLPMAIKMTSLTLDKQLFITQIFISFTLEKTIQNGCWIQIYTKVSSLLGGHQFSWILLLW